MPLLGPGDMARSRLERQTAGVGYAPSYQGTPVDPGFVPEGFGGYAPGGGGLPPGMSPTPEGSGQVVDTSRTDQDGAGFLDSLLSGLDDPRIAAALGAGGSLMAAADRGGGLGEALRAGLGGGAGGLLGAGLRRRRKKKDEEERQLLLDAVTSGYRDVAEDGNMPNLAIYRAMLGTLGE